MIAFVSADSRADEASAPAHAAPSSERSVAARVDGQPVYADEVRRRIERVLANRKIEPEARPLLEAETLVHLVDRQLILQFLENRKVAATGQDLDAEASRIERHLAQQNLTLDQYLEQTQQTRDDLRAALRWEVSWQRYLEQQLTDENLEKYFARHAREFDGTELRVAHVLLKPTRPDDAASLAEKVRRAEELRVQIEAGQLTFAEAAKQHSQAPTAEAGGDIGFIGRRAPMPEPFSQAAYQLKDGETSEPTVTPFGVHLIHVLETKPGQKTWRDVRGELSQAVAAFLFTWAADQQRPHAKIEYTGAVPHFKPGTRTVE